MITEKTETDRAEKREHLRDALLRGDRSAVELYCRQGMRVYLRQVRDELLEELTVQCLEGTVPFSQLTVTAQAACALAGNGTPVACCGSLVGNPCDTGRNFIWMLLRAWGIPVLDLGAEVPAAQFLNAVAEQGIRFVIVTAFSAEDAGAAGQLHRMALEMGIRDQFDLLICGARFDEELRKKLQLACADHRAAAAARWVGQRWKNR